MIGWGGAAGVSRNGRRPRAPPGGCARPLRGPGRRLAPGGLQERRYTVAFANLTEEAGVALEGTGFTGADIRQSFDLAARGLPVDVVFYDNHRDGVQGAWPIPSPTRSGRKVDLYVQYLPDPAVNKDVAERLRSAGIPVLAVNYPVPGAPLYGTDNRGRRSHRGRGAGALRRNRVVERAASWSRS